MTGNIRVAVLGAAGKMGGQSVEAIDQADGMEVVAALSRADPLKEITNCRAQVILDFTTPESSFDNVAYAVKNNIHAVVGTSGWDERKCALLSARLEERPEVGVLIAPNFAIGAVLATRFAALAAPYFESVEIVELHHPEKLDAPSGTAVRTAEGIARSRAKAKVPEARDATIPEARSARGVKVSGIPVHSVRLQGLTAHQEVLFGGEGEGLTLRHDSYDRKSFMPGVVLGIRGVGRNPGLSLGLDSYLDL